MSNMTTSYSTSYLMALPAVLTQVTANDYQLSLEYEHDVSLKNLEKMAEVIPSGGRIGSAHLFSLVFPVKETRQYHRDLASARYLRADKGYLTCWAQILKGEIHCNGHCSASGAVPTPPPSQRQHRTTGQRLWLGADLKGGDPLQRSLFCKRGSSYPTSIAASASDDRTMTLERCSALLTNLTNRWAEELTSSRQIACGTELRKERNLVINLN